MVFTEPFDWRHDRRDDEAATAGRLPCGAGVGGGRTPAPVHCRPDDRGAPGGARRGRRAGWPGRPLFHRRRGGRRVPLDETLGALLLAGVRTDIEQLAGRRRRRDGRCGAARSLRPAGQQRVDLLGARRQRGGRSAMSSTNRSTGSVIPTDCAAPSTSASTPRHRRIGCHHHVHLPPPRVRVSDPVDAIARQMHRDDAEPARGARHHRWRCVDRSGQPAHRVSIGGHCTRGSAGSSSSPR